MSRLAPTLAVLALTLTAGAARADDDDPDGDFVRFPVKSMAVGIQGHGTRVRGHSEGGIGATLEMAYGRGRWQYVAEGSIASSSLETGTMAIDEPLGGHLWRGALGARWLARQFTPDSSFGVELFLLGQAGMEHYHYDGGDKLTRPEVAFGFGIQGRGFKAPRFGFRLDARLLFTPSGHDSAPGFLTGLAFPW